MVGIRRESVRSDISTTPSTIEEWIARKDVFRVVAHGLPMTMPVMVKRGDPRLCDIYVQHVEPDIADVLTQYGISCSLTRLDYWYPKYEEENGEHTVLIHSHDTNTGAWPAAARKVHSLLRDHGANRITTRLQVEIRNPEKFYNDVSKRLPNDSQLLEALAEIEPEVINTVCSFMEASWSSIAYHTRVHRQADYDALGKPTIIVFCYPGSSCDYDKAEERLLQILKAVPLDVHLEFLPGKITPPARGAVAARFLYNTPRKPVNGSSIGVEGKTSEAGSLGGWVTLSLPKQHRTIRCAITSYHVVKSIDAAITAHTDTHGVMLNGRRGHETVEYPAAYDAIHTLSQLNRICTQNPDDAEAANAHQTLSAQFTNPGIGRVILASGYRNRNGRLSDWALIESSSTFSANKPPPGEAIRAPFNLPENFLYSQNSDSRVREFGEAKLGDWVTKTGRSTGCTSGKINKMERVIPGLGPPGIPTKQAEIISHEGDFAGPGDSGSMETGQRGEFLGLVGSIDQYSGCYNAAFMTTIQQIQQDIKDFTGDGFISVD